MTMRNLVALAFLSLVGAAHADFNGPAPLAWRWVEPTAVSPSGSPVVDGERTFVAVGRRVFSIDKNSGNMLWRYPLEAPLDGYFRSGCILAEGVIVAPADNNTIYGIDANSGQARWQFISQFPIVGSPILVNKFVVARLNNQTLIALDPTTGQAVWRDEQNQARPLRVMGGISSPLGTQGSNVLLFTGTNVLRAIDVSTQKITWDREFSTVSAGTVPTVWNDLIVVNSGTYVVAVDVASGRLRWQTNTGEFLTFSPTVSSAGLLVVSVSGKAYLLDRNGRMLGTPATLDSRPRAQPTGVGGMFVIPSANGSLNLLDPKTGQTTWTYFIQPLAAQTSSSPAPGGFPPRGGQPGGASSNTTSAQPLSIPAAGAPVIVGDTLLVLAMDGSLLAFDKNLGVDLEGPEIAMVWPEGGAQVSGRQLELFFTVADPAGGVKPDTVSVEINGQKLDTEYGRDGFAIVRFSLLGKNKPLADGRKTIVVKAKDWMGNESSKQFVLFIDNSLAPLARPGAGTNPIGGPPGAGGGARGGLGGG